MAKKKKKGSKAAIKGASKAAKSEARAKKPPNSAVASLVAALLNSGLSKKQMTGKPDKMFLPSGSTTKDALAEALVYTAAKMQSELGSSSNGLQALKELVTKKAERDLDSDPKCVEEWTKLIQSAVSWLPWANGFVGQNPCLMAALLDSDVTPAMKASRDFVRTSRAETAEAFIHNAVKKHCDAHQGLQALKDLVSDDLKARLDSAECVQEWERLVAIANSGAIRSPFDRVGLVDGSVDNASTNGPVKSVLTDSIGSRPDNVNVLPADCSTAHTVGHSRIDEAARRGLDKLHSHFSEDGCRRLEDLGDDAPTLFVEVMHHCASPELRLLCRQHAQDLLSEHERMLLECHSKARRRTFFFQCIHIARAKRDLGLDAEPLLVAADHTYEANGFGDTDILFGVGKGGLGGVDTREWVLLLMHVYVVDHMNITMVRILCMVECAMRGVNTAVVECAMV
jgi:hypothetical protein